MKRTKTALVAKTSPPPDGNQSGTFPSLEITNYSSGFGKAPIAQPPKTPYNMDTSLVFAGGNHEKRV
jgi:hypothetical protein